MAIPRSGRVSLPGEVVRRGELSAHLTIAFHQEKAQRKVNFQMEPATKDLTQTSLHRNQVQKHQG